MLKLFQVHLVSFDKVDIVMILVILDCYFGRTKDPSCQILILRRNYLSMIHPVSFRLRICVLCNFHQPRAKRSRRWGRLRCGLLDHYTFPTLAPYKWTTDGTFNIYDSFPTPKTEYRENLCNLDELLQTNAVKSSINRLINVSLSIPLKQSPFSSRPIRIFCF